jgi:hypothetical protein
MILRLGRLAAPIVVVTSRRIRIRIVVRLWLDAVQTLIVRLVQGILVEQLAKLGRSVVFELIEDRLADVSSSGEL